MTHPPRFFIVATFLSQPPQYHIFAFHLPPSANSTYISLSPNRLSGCPCCGQRVDYE